MSHKEPNTPPVVAAMPGISRNVPPPVAPNKDPKEISDAFERINQGWAEGSREMKKRNAEAQRRFDIMVDEHPSFADPFWPRQRQLFFKMRDRQEAVDGPDGHWNATPENQNELEILSSLEFLIDAAIKQFGPRSMAIEKVLRSLPKGISGYEKTQDRASFINERCFLQILLKNRTKSPDDISAWYTKAIRAVGLSDQRRFELEDHMQGLVSALSSGSPRPEYIVAPAEDADAENSGIEIRNSNPGLTPPGGAVEVLVSDIPTSIKSRIRERGEIPRHENAEPLTGHDASIKLPAAILANATPEDAEEFARQEIVLQNQIREEWSQKFFEQYSELITEARKKASLLDDSDEIDHIVEREGERARGYAAHLQDLWGFSSSQNFLNDQASPGFVEDCLVAVYAHPEDVNNFYEVMRGFIKASLYVVAFEARKHGLPKIVRPGVPHRESDAVSATFSPEDIVKNLRLEQQEILGVTDLSTPEEMILAFEACQRAILKAEKKNYANVDRRMFKVERAMESLYPRGAGKSWQEIIRHRMSVKEKSDRVAQQEKGIRIALRKDTEIPPDALIPPHLIQEVPKVEKRKTPEDILGLTFGASVEEIEDRYLSLLSALNIEDTLDNDRIIELQSAREAMLQRVQRRENEAIRAQALADDLAPKKVPLAEPSKPTEKALAWHERAFSAVADTMTDLHNSAFDGAHRLLKPAIAVLFGAGAVAAGVALHEFAQNDSDEPSVVNPVADHVSAADAFSIDQTTAFHGEHFTEGVDNDQDADIGEAAPKTPFVKVAEALVVPEITDHVVKKGDVLWNMVTHMIEDRDLSVTNEKINYLTHLAEAENKITDHGVSLKVGSVLHLSDVAHELDRMEGKVMPDISPEAYQTPSLPYDASSLVYDGRYGGTYDSSHYGVAGASQYPNAETTSSGLTHPETAYSSLPTVEDPGHAMQKGEWIYKIIHNMLRENGLNWSVGRMNTLKNKTLAENGLSEAQAMKIPVGTVITFAEAARDIDAMAAAKKKGK